MEKDHVPGKFKFMLTLKGLGENGLYAIDKHVEIAGEKLLRVQVTFVWMKTHPQKLYIEKQE